MESARIALNQVLSLDQDRRWSLEEVGVDAERFNFLDGRLGIPTPLRFHRIAGRLPAPE